MTPSKFLRSRGAADVFHFTDVANLAGIRKVGKLLSRAELARRRIVVPKPGGNDWSADADARSGLDEYVHLCLTTDHPMEYCARKEGWITEVRYLHIDLAIADLPGVVYTIGVANKSGTMLLPFEKARDLLDYDVLYARTDWRDPQIRQRLQLARKCEILIPKEVDAKLISNL